MKGCARELDDIGLRIFGSDPNADWHRELVVRADCGYAPQNCSDAVQSSASIFVAERNALDFDGPFDGHFQSPVGCDDATVEALAGRVPLPCRTPGRSALAEAA